MIGRLNSTNRTVTGVGPAQDPIWLVTLADLMGLMLVFFVMLFAMSALDRQELEKVTGIAIVEPATEVGPSLLRSSLPPAESAGGRDPHYLASVIRAKFEGETALRDLVVSDLGERALIEVPIATLVRDEDVAANQERLMHALAGALRSLPNRVSVDARFVGADASTNRAMWRSSLMLAWRAARALERAGLPGPVDARAMIGARSGHSGLDIVIFAAGMTSGESTGP